MAISSSVASSQVIFSRIGSAAAIASLNFSAFSGSAASAAVMPA